jgi:Tfp pilus assembly protein PilN
MNFSFSDIRKSTSAAGVEAIVANDGALVFNYVILKKEKSKLVIEKRGSGIKDITALVTDIGSKIPVILVLNGKGILHRKVHASGEESKSELLGKVLPNAAVEDFSVQLSQADESTGFVSVLRTGQLESNLKSLISGGLINISNVFIGPFVFKNIIPLLRKETITAGKVNTGSMLITFNHESIDDVSYDAAISQGEVYVDSEPVHPSLLVSFSAAFNFFTNAYSSSKLSAYAEEIKDLFHQKKKFEKNLVLLLISTFLVLILNFFVFDHYWRKGNEINQKLELSQLQLKQYEDLEKELNEKRALLDQNGIMDRSLTSFYADRLAAELPASISWTQLAIHPLKKEKGETLENVFLFDKATVRISGRCKQSVVLNEWIKSLRKVEWIKDVALSNYTQDNIKESGVFSLAITLR